MPFASVNPTRDQAPKTAPDSQLASFNGLDASLHQAAIGVSSLVGKLAGAQTDAETGMAFDFVGMGLNPGSYA